MTHDESARVIAALRLRLEEADETLRAIRDGSVDAIVLGESSGPRVYTLDGADRPYRDFVERMHQAAVTLHADGSVAYANGRLAEMLLTPHERLVGSPLAAFVPEADRGDFAALLRDRAEGEGRLARADGRVVPVHLSFHALPGDCGAAVGVLVTDLTAQKHRERLAAALAENERLFGEAKSEISRRERVEEELRRAAGELAEADRRKNEFLALLAHELRNPLAPIRNSLKIVRLTADKSPTLARAAEMMERQVTQMVRLIDDLLDVSRITRGKIELRPEAVELGAAVAQVAEASRPTAEAAGLTMSVYLPDQPIHLRADPTRLAQVVGNLINNACKFTDRGGRVEVVAVREGSDAVVRVRDTGIGIAAEELSRIFEMFTQIDTSLERTRGGLGIGLTLVKTFAEMHGGGVSVRSDGPGRGSEFEVRLPAS